MPRRKRDVYAQMKARVATEAIAGEVPGQALLWRGGDSVERLFRASLRVGGDIEVRVQTWVPGHAVRISVHNNVLEFRFRVSRRGGSVRVIGSGTEAGTFMAKNCKGSPVHIQRATRALELVRKRLLREFERVTQWKEP